MKMAKSRDPGYARPGGAGVGPTYVGAGAAGGGTVFNGVTADSKSGPSDHLTVTASGLLSDTGTATTVGLTIGPVGGDDNPPGSAVSATRTPASAGPGIDPAIQ